MKWLKEGLGQIPVKYLKENLLPMLEADDPRLLYSGDIVRGRGDSRRYGPMVAAHSVEVRDSDNAYRVFDEEWERITDKPFFVDPGESGDGGYTAELIEYRRDGCLQVVRELIEEAESAID